MEATLKNSIKDIQAEIDKTGLFNYYNIGFQKGLEKAIEIIKRNIEQQEVDNYQKHRIIMPDAHELNNK